MIRSTKTPPSRPSPMGYGPPATDDNSARNKLHLYVRTVDPVSLHDFNVVHEDDELDAADRFASKELFLQWQDSEIDQLSPVTAQAAAMMIDHLTTITVANGSVLPLSKLPVSIMFFEHGKMVIVGQR